MIRRIALPQLVASGAAGAAAGTVVSREPVRGELLAVYLDYGGTVATQDVTILTHGSPTITLLSRSNSATDGWVYPRQQVHNAADASALTYDGTRPVCEPAAVCDYVEVRLAQADDGDTLDVTLLVRE